jgi:hypothetical protein
MARYRKRPACRNHHPDLFDWLRERELRRVNPAARRISERFDLPLHQAITIAALAGIGPQGER